MHDRVGRGSSRRGATIRPPRAARSSFAVVLALLAALAVTPTAAAAPGPLRVLSLNIHHAEGLDGRVDLDRLARELRAADADVLGLQEVDRHFDERSGSVDQAAELADRLGLHHAFGAHLDLGPPAPGRPPRQYGTAVLSRHPVLSATTTRLPGPPDDEPRGVLEVVLAAPGGPVRVLVTHLSPQGSATRQPQARALAAIVARSPEPVLLLGDLNAEPGTPEVRTLTALLSDAGAGPTFPADAPAERIDYVLGDARFADAAVLPTTSSDHRGVLATALLR